MKLCRMEDVKFPQTYLLCRQGRLVGTIVGLVLCAVVFGAGPLWRKLGAPAFVWIGCLVLAVMIVPMIIGSVVALYRRANWLLAAGPEGMWINIRSPYNGRLVPADTVVWLENSEIEAFAIYREECTLPDGSTARRSIRRRTEYLQITLNHRDTEPLAESLRQERARKPRPRRLLGVIAVRTRIRHFPVAVPSPGVIRVAWRGGRGNHVIPGLQIVLKALQVVARIAEAQEHRLEDWKELDEKDAMALAENLAISGDLISAARLLASRHGLSLTEAMDRAERLAAEAPK